MIHSRQALSFQGGVIVRRAGCVEYGSRCEQYGGHWQGHKCVGISSRGQGHVTVKDVACTVAGAAGGAAGGVPGALIAGGICIVVWP
jgi:hypothetical protein